jgi:hypothetical protein
LQVSVPYKVNILKSPTLCIFSLIDGGSATLS